MMTIAIGNDHAAPDYKFAVLEYLESQNIKVINYGTDTVDSVDYPDFVHPVASDVNEGKVDFGILFCGSANGVAMTVVQVGDCSGLGYIQGAIMDGATLAREI